MGYEMEGASPVPLNFLGYFNSTGLRSIWEVSPECSSFNENVCYEPSLTLLPPRHPPPPK